MASNKLGEIFTVSSFGESHGAYIGAMIDGVPSGFSIDLNEIQKQLSRRRPGQSRYTTSRSEKDECEIVSGLMEGVTTGAPICILIKNKNQKSSDYSELATVYRPSHADYVYDKKFGIRNVAGGGRSSARITAGWVAAGAIAEQILHQLTNIKIVAWVNQVYQHRILSESYNYTREQVDQSPVRCPSESISKKIQEEITLAREAGDSLGGTIHCKVSNCPVGLGDPVFSKLHANLGQAMLSINAVKGVEFGSGFGAASLKGSEHNDPWFHDESKGFYTSSNNSGGIQGGISNGMPINFQIAFKPTASINNKQETTTIEGEKKVLEIKGRHDPCVLPRAVPIVEAMTAIVLLDAYLMNLIHKTR